MCITSIELRFIHKAPTTPQDDEIVHITPYKNSDNEVAFMWRYIYSNKTANVSLLKSESEVREMLRSLGDLMSWDKDPYGCVQLLLPTMPSALFSMASFPKAMEETVLHSISCAIRSWPVKMDYQEAKNMCEEGLLRHTNAEPKAAARAAVAAPNSCSAACEGVTGCTRSGRYYTPLRSKHSDSPPPLVRLSGKNQYDFTDGYGSYFEVKHNTNNNASRILNPEDNDEWDD